MNEIKELDKVFYEIKVRGQLDAWWEEMFDGMTIVSGDHITTISGFIADQAALHGLLAKVRDFGLTLISINCKESKKK